MLQFDENTNPGVLPSEVLGAEIWEDIPRLYVDWVNATRSGDWVLAAGAEQRLRFFALTYASLLPDSAGVTTGRKAILRSIYAQLGGADTAHVAAMLDLVIAREQAAARRKGKSASAH